MDQLLCNDFSAQLTQPPREACVKTVDLPGRANWAWPLLSPFGIRHPHQHAATIGPTPN